MNTIALDHDIKVFCVTATSFPEGVMQAHQKLHSLIPFSTERKYYGLSRPENGKILYKAGANELHEGEFDGVVQEYVVVKKGQYISMDIHDYMKNIEAIGNTFQEMLTHPGLDPQGYCVEWYISDKDVRCMVRLAGN